MNARIVELTRNPDLIGTQDLALLKKEIAKYPYIQSLRALHLLGTHRLDAPHYAGELSITAAYTTDKKILYQLINGPEPATEPAEEAVVTENETTVKNMPQDNSENLPEAAQTAEEISSKADDHAAYTEVKPKTMDAPAAVFVNGERNRLLFPGEEDFLTTETPLLDLEATLESGSIVLRETPQVPVTEEEQLPAEEAATVVDAEERAGNQAAIDADEGTEKEQNATAEEETAEAGETKATPEMAPTEESVIHEPSTRTDQTGESTDAETFTREQIVHEQQPEAEKAEVEDLAELSFHEVDTFLAETNETDNEVSAEEAASQDANGETTSTPDAAEAETESQQDKAAAETSTAVVEKVSKESPSAETEAAGEALDAETFTREKIVHEQQPEAEKTEVEDPAELSFHGLDAFLPEVKMPIAETKPVAAPAAENEPNRHEEERLRLIAEVEARMKAAKKPRTATAPEEPVSHEVNFAETASFHSENDEQKTESAVESAPDTNITSDWKPMQLAQTTPDALMRKTAAATEKKEVETAVKEESAPIVDQHAKDSSAEDTEKTSEAAIAESNVPAFIDTWQSWLKIERSEQQEHKTQISITEIRNKVIENFIEKEPKISKLRDESDFVVRERNDDIWHLMTETLANLYTEQKLYAKAIKAFQVLTEKHPGKTEHYAGKIEEIKEIRQRNGR